MRLAPLESGEDVVPLRAFAADSTADAPSQWARDADYSCGGAGACAGAGAATTAVNYNDCCASCWPS